MELAKARAVVTGGASGLGAAVVRMLLNRGAQVAVFDLGGRPTPLPEKQAARCHAFRVDVTDAAAVSAAIEGAAAAMGGLTLAVNCAGIATGARVLGRDGPHPLESFHRTVEINLVGSFNVARLAAARMALNAPTEDGERGVIVNTASIAAFEGQKGQAAYAASKAGVAGMTLPMARDLAGIGVRVCTVAPGVFLTPMLEGLGPEIAEGLAADVPFPKRLGRPEEFARLVAAIVEIPYLNAETIRLDGGLRMKG